MTDKILKAISEFEAVREKATQGEWIAYESQPRVYYVNATGRSLSLEIASLYESALDEAKDCAIFIVQAANNATKFTQALRVAVEQLEREECWRTLGEIERTLLEGK